MNYWLNIVYWSFGSWKTFWTFLQMYEQVQKKKDRDETFIISNVPYGVVDLFYSTPDELLQVIVLLEHYISVTNDQINDYYENVHKYKNIIVICDESHLYFDSRHAVMKGNNMEKLNLVLTQCRKRKIKFYMITQRLSNIDIRLRKLCDYVEEYKKYNILWLLQRCRKKIYENLWDIWDIESDQVMRVVDGETVTHKKEALISSSLFRPLTTFFNIFSFLNPSYRKIQKEEYLSFFVVWLPYYNTNIEKYKDNFINNLKIKNG